MNCTEEAVSFFSALEKSGVSSDAVEKLQLYAESQCLQVTENMMSLFHLTNDQSHCWLEWDFGQHYRKLWFDSTKI